MRSLVNLKAFTVVSERCQLDHKSYIQDKGMACVFTFRVLFKHETSVEHFKILNVHSPVKDGDRRMESRWEKLDLLMEQLQVMKDPLRKTLAVVPIHNLSECNLCFCPLPR